ILKISRFFSKNLPKALKLHINMYYLPKKLCIACYEREIGSGLNWFDPQINVICNRSLISGTRHDELVLINLTILRNDNITLILISHQIDRYIERWPKLIRCLFFSYVFITQSNYVK